MAVDADKLNEFLVKFVTDLGATVAAGNVVIGHNLGLYKTLAAAPATAEDLAAATRTSPRYVAEWLRGQAAGSYVQYDPAGDTYSMTEEQAFALINPDGGVYAPGGFVAALGSLKACRGSPRRSGPVPGWAGTSRTRTSSPAASSSSGRATSPTSCRPGSRRSTAWRTSCGPARPWPTSAAGSARPPSCSPSSTRTPGSPGPTTTTGRSRRPASTPVTRASPTGSASRSPASTFSGTGYDLAATFDCLHDMGDPLAAARHIRQALKPDGTWLIVEPAAADDVAGNLNPVGRVYYSASTLLCVPNALSQSGGYALGAQAGEAAIRQVITDAGFTRFRRAAETPFNLVYEVRP